MSPRLLGILGTGLLLACGYWIQSRVMLNHDVAWISHSAGWMLDGRQFGVDIVDVNPPLAWLLSIPGAAMSRLGFMSEPTSVRLLYFAYVALAAWLLEVVLARSTLRSDGGALAWRVAFLVSATLLPAFSFGQREFVCFVLSAPYLAAAALTLRGEEPASLRIKLLVGVLAGLGFGLKPYFLAVPALVELLILVRLGPRAVWRPEAIAIAATVAVYLACVVVLMPEYLTVIVPAARAYYWAYENPNFGLVLGRLNLPALMLGTGLLLAGMARAWSSLGSVSLAAAIGFAASYLVQAKGFVYHAYPVIGASLLFLAASLGAYLSCIVRNRPGWPAWVRVGAAVLSVALALPTLRAAHDDVARWYFVHNTGWGQLGLQRKAIVELVNLHAPRKGQYFFAFSTHPFPAFPTGSYTSAEWSGRAVAQAPLAAYGRIAEVSDPVLRQRIEAAALAQRREVTEDMERRLPAIVLVDTSAVRLGLQKTPFDDLAFYLEDPEFRRVWSRFREIDPVGPYRVFLLSATGRQS